MEFTVDRGDCRLYCEKRGAGPLLLMIHGVVCDSDYFRAAAEYLSNNFTVVTYDRRGYTRSACAPDSDWSVENQSMDAASVINACGGSAYVVGCSAGGVIALELVRSHPELVRKLFLHEPPASNDAEYLKELEDWRSELRVFAAEKRTAKAMLSFVHRLGGVDKRSEKRSLEEQTRDIKTLPVFLFHEQEHLLGYIADKLKNVRPSVPCVVAMGELDPDGLFHKACPGAAEALGARLIHVPGYHNFALDLPYEFAATVTGVMLTQEERV